MRSSNIAPLYQQGGKVSQEVVESLASSLLLGDELANRFEPHRGVGLEHSAVVDQQLQYKDPYVEMAVFPINFLG
jgi:hypothetical protein